MNNLLLITDVARLRKIFGRLTEDKNIRLRVVNNLEKGGEEIAVEKPDVVFVQTHLSGLSADILLMHLKKQLGRKRSRFVLLATPDQTNDAILKSFQGWINTSLEDNLLLSRLQQLLITLLSKPKKGEESSVPEPIAAVAYKPQPVSGAESAALLNSPPVSEDALPQEISSGLQLQVISPPPPEPSLEEQGITYSPRQRLSVYSEFNSSFDDAVSSAPEPESIEQATPALARDWNAEVIDTVEPEPARSKRGTFLLWLLPVVGAVVIITYLQQKGPSATSEPSTAKPAAQAPSAKTPAPDSAKEPSVTPVTPPAPSQGHDRMSDTAVLSAIAENRGSKDPADAASSGARLTSLPDFIPRDGFDKQFSTTNPGWERYRGRVTEFKVLREAKAIKAIQVIDRGGQGVPESFMKDVLRKVTKKPTLRVDSTEKKDGYEIQRGRIAENIKVVYYRDESGGKLRAFVLAWQ